MKDTFDSEGIVTAPSVLDAAEIALIRRKIEEVLRRGGPGRVLVERDGHTPRSLANQHLEDPFFAALTAHPKLVEPVREVLGDEVYVFQLGINVKAPFRGDIWSWHRDYPTYHSEDHIPTPRMVNVLVYLDEFNRLNGSFMYLPRTHGVVYETTGITNQGTSHDLRYASEAELSAHMAEMTPVFQDGGPGTILLMNTNLLHGSAANLSHKTRWLITLTYNAMSNKATQRSERQDIVPDDADAPPVQPNAADYLLQHFS